MPLVATKTPSKREPSQKRFKIAGPAILVPATRKEAIVALAQRFSLHMSANGFSSRPALDAVMFHMEENFEGSCEPEEVMAALKK